MSWNSVPQNQHDGAVAGGAEPVVPGGAAGRPLAAGAVPPAPAHRRADPVAPALAPTARPGQVPALDPGPAVAPLHHLRRRTER